MDSRPASTDYPFPACVDDGGSGSSIGGFWTVRGAGSLRAGPFSGPPRGVDRVSQTERSGARISPCKRLESLGSARGARVRGKAEEMRLVPRNLALRVNTP